MKPEVTLTVSDEFGSTRQLVVQSKRFTIGRTPENDLAIENSSLSRRHAVIENFDGVVQISDCGSQNGTEVNGAPILASTILHDGDVITLAGVCDIEVVIAENGEGSDLANHPTSSALQAQWPATSSVRQATGPGPSGTSRNVSGVQAPWLNTPGAHLLGVTAGILVILVAGGLLLFVLNKGRKQGLSANRQPVTQKNQNQNQDIQQSLDTADNANSVASPGGTDLDSGTGTKDGAATQAQVETAAAGVMHRISSDDKTYSFSEKALQDISRKVNQYRNSASLVGNLSAIQRNGAALGATARQQGIEPGLLIYLVLAEAEGARTVGEPRAIAQGAIGDLLALRATFGTNDADGSLLIVAAYKMGRGEKRSHPLLATIRRLVKNPLIQRNVWYLNERGGLEPAVYDFVVGFVALGVIAQNPGQFGVAATPLVF